MIDTLVRYEELSMVCADRHVIVWLLRLLQTSHPPQNLTLGGFSLGFRHLMDRLLACYHGIPTSRATGCTCVRFFASGRYFGCGERTAQEQPSRKIYIQNTTTLSIDSSLSIPVRCCVVARADIDFGTKSGTNDGLTSCDTTAQQQS